MKTETVYKNIFASLIDNDLGKALNAYGEHLHSLNRPLFAERFHDIENDYRLMLDFLYRGFKDKEREALYNKLIGRLDRLVADTMLSEQIEKHPLFKEKSVRLQSFNAQKDFVKQQVEAFVADLAILDFDDDSIKQEKQRELYNNHHEFLCKLFDYIWLSPQWNEDDLLFYQNLLLSPTVEVNDVLLIVSAIFLANSQVFDAQKTQLLIRISLKSEIEAVRQRALVGWALTLDNRSLLYPEISKSVDAYCSDVQRQKQLVELQKQLYFCLNAEKDHDAIQRDIMPDLIKNSNLTITPFGIEEKDDNKLQDILNSEAAEEAVDKVEKSFQKMIDMQKAGADIYFGGFSQMKRFPFFYQTANWFCPFYSQHPALNSVLDNIGNSAFIDNLLSHGPFCDSDKYSFVLAMSQIVTRLPENIREMMGNSSVFEIQNADQDTTSPTYIRRMYLQNIYRFFKLFSNKQLLNSPFLVQQEYDDSALFITQSIFISSIFLDNVCEIGQFLLRMKNYRELERLMPAIENHRSSSSLLLNAQWLMLKRDYDNASEIYSELLLLNPYDTKALAGKARADFNAGRYDEASKLYKQLADIQDKSLAPLLNYCVAMSHTDKVTETVDLLYKLYYENPDNLTVHRILAWNLLASQRKQQAEAEYAKLLSAENPAPEDYLNAAYSAWVNRQIESSVSLFRTYLNKLSDSSDKFLQLNYKIQSDSYVLKSNGVDSLELKLMSDLVLQNSQD